MAEEDLIWGKNRHFFGGIEPSNMLTFNAKSYYDIENSAGRVRLQIELPKDTTINGQQLCTVSGAIIRKSSEGYPKDEFDGELLADIKENGDLYDTDVVIGNTYYYSAFPYTAQGVYNRSVKNRASVKVQTYTYFFGYDLALSTQSPDTRVSYPDEVDNHDYAPAAMNFTNGVFGYGSWPSVAGEKFMPRPCMLGYDGKVKEYLNENNYAKKTDGTNSNVANKAFRGNAMMEWPKIYTHREVVDGVYKFRCSDIPLGEDWDCWSNYDIEDNVIDHFYTSIYFGSNVSGRLRSISGQTNYVSNTAQTEVSLAMENGEDWYIEEAVDRFLIQDLLVMMAKSTETQTKFGYGRCASGNTSAIGQGTMNTKGLFWGSTDQTSGVKVFGMENWWGNIWRRMAGWINANGTQKIKITRGRHDGSTIDGYNFDGSGYIAISGATPAGTSGGYISKTKDTKWGRIPYQASGSSTTYEADGLWFNNGQVDYAIVGGYWNYALLAGAFYVHLSDAPSNASTHIGAALSCKPLAQ